MKRISHTTTYSRLLSYNFGLPRAIPMIHPSTLTGYLLAARLQSATPLAARLQSRMSPAEQVRSKELLSIYGMRDVAVRLHTAVGAFMRASSLAADPRTLYHNRCAILKEITFLTTCYSIGMVLCRRSSVRARHYHIYRILVHLWFTPIDCITFGVTIPDITVQCKSSKMVIRIPVSTTTMYMIVKHLAIHGAAPMSSAPVSVDIRHLRLLASSDSM